MRVPESESARGEGRHSCEGRERQSSLESPRRELQYLRKTTLAALRDSAYALAVVHRVARFHCVREW